MGYNKTLSKTINCDQRKLTEYKKRHSINIPFSSKVGTIIKLVYLPS